MIYPFRKVDANEKVVPTFLVLLFWIDCVFNILDQARNSFIQLLPLQLPLLLLLTFQLSLPLLLTFQLLPLLLLTLQLLLPLLLLLQLQFMLLLHFCLRPRVIL